MDYRYLITPFFAWFCCGVLKFIINCLKEKRIALDLIGYGGMPSNHSAIVSSMTSLIAFKEGIDSPAFGVAVTLAFIIILDANGLRKKMETYAIEINKIKNYNQPILRERVGHNKLEITAGILVGITMTCVIVNF